MNEEKLEGLRSIERINEHARFLHESYREGHSTSVGIWSDLPKHDQEGWLYVAESSIKRIIELGLIELESKKQKMEILDDLQLLHNRENNNVAQSEGHTMGLLDELQNHINKLKQKI